MTECLRPHDLVRLTPRAISRIEQSAPAWARGSLRDAPWATVRRAYVSGAVAVGIRGPLREQRFAASARDAEIAEVIRPEELIDTVPSRDHGVFAALGTVVRAARARQLPVGPIGAAGFELGTGVRAVHNASDLDVIVRAPPSCEKLQSFASDLRDLGVRVDVEVAFGNGYGVALEEVVRGGPVLVKTPSGPRMLPAFSIANAAVQSLIAEAELTPKPALVDRRGSGAHVDLSLELLVRSAETLRETFEAVAAESRGAAIDASLRGRLGAIGREGERRMLAVTGGVNTHRGAIWSLGLLVAAASLSRSRDPETIATVAAAIASISDATRGAYDSNGARACARFGVRGAAGEARDAFPHAVQRALPALRAGRERGRPESIARVDALLCVMTTLDDTCLLHRGGAEALRAAQQGAGATLAAGGIGAPGGALAFDALESELLARNASPGGAADSLAAALLLDSIERQTWA